MIVIVQGPLAERMGCSPVEAVRQAIADEEELVAELASDGGYCGPNAECRAWQRRRSGVSVPSWPG